MASGRLEPMREAARIVMRHLEGILGHYEVRSDNRLLGSTQPSVLGDEGRSPRLSVQPLSGRQALLRRAEAGDNTLLIPIQMIPKPFPLAIFCLSTCPYNY